MTYDNAIAELHAEIEAVKELLAGMTRTASNQSLRACLRGQIEAYKYAIDLLTDND